MWLDRFSNQPTPAGSPPPSRSSFQAQRRPNPQALGATARPGFSPRSSSLGVPKFNASTTSLNSPRLLPNGSGLKQELLPPPDLTDPLAVLEEILGQPLCGADGGGAEALPVDKPAELVEDVDFAGLSLQDFVEQKGTSSDEQTASVLRTVEYEKDKDQFEDLHKSILACDQVLSSVEVSLSNFQDDLGTVSAEIETLQNRSAALNTKLENRKVVEQLLGPAVEDICIAPAIVRKISEGPVDHEWVEALRVLERRSKAIEGRLRGSDKILAVSDVKPLLDDLTNIAIERIRDFFVSQIKSLRSPNINAQVIQQRTFLPYKDLYAFLTKHHPQLAEQIAQAYSHTMRWYYLSHFSRYKQALEKIPLYAVDTTDALGADPNARRANVPPHAPAPLSLGHRGDILDRSNSFALPSHVAEDSKTPTHLETPFHAFSTAVMDNASFEYAFMTAFFASASFPTISHHFNTIFAPTFALGHNFLKSLVDSTYDCLGILLCVRITQHLAFELQRRRCPVADGYINGTNMLLWPRFQIAMDAHIDSVKRAAAALPSSSARTTLSLTASKEDGSKSSTAPHMLTQRFAQFVEGILSLVEPASTASTSKGVGSPMSAQLPGARRASVSSVEQATDTTPISRSMGRLRMEFEAFLGKAAKGLAQGRKERFLSNNYSLILTIIAESGGNSGLAKEMRGRFQEMKDVS